MHDASNSFRIGADVGGTFTDVILIDAAGTVRSRKVPSTPPNFEQAVLQAVQTLLPEANAEPAAVSDVAHGTTVATNAVLERRGAHTALITTRGFRDVLELRRIRAPQLYDLFFVKPPSLVDRYLRFELDERMSADGAVLKTPSEAELLDLKQRLLAENVESVAVCFLHSYAFPQHEQFVGEFLREHLPDVQVSLSCDVLRERREYERTATTVVNAYVRPLMQRYLQAMQAGLAEQQIDASLLIMQSAGGLTPEEDAAQRPVFVLESGPAAGVLAASFTARQSGIGNAITFDMGGTTAKAAMIEGGRISYSPEYEVGATLSSGNRLVGGGGELIRAPTIDIAEVGAGGGSIAFIDRGGGLRVGPRSAGAVPGPVCYNRGGSEPTVTDANVVLGLIRTGELADGQIVIDAEAACRAVHDQIAAPLGMDVYEAAAGILHIANARMMRALREVSTNRGRDPREFALIAFGGSGPIHAAGLARELHALRVIVPPLPGLFSTLGLLFSGIEHHDARSCRLAGAELTAESIDRLNAELRELMLARFQSEGLADDQIEFAASVDVRFRGQTSEIRIRLDDVDVTDNTIDRMHAAFEEEHERLYGHRSDPDNPVEVVAVRLIGRVPATQDFKHIQPVDFKIADNSSRQVWSGRERGMREVPVIRRRDLADHGEGPLLIDEYDSTIVIPPHVPAELDEFGNVVIRLDD